MRVKTAISFLANGYSSNQEVSQTRLNTDIQSKHKQINSVAIDNPIHVSPSK